MSTTCEIEFENNPDKVIYAGQLLRGTVWLTSTERKRIRVVYIQISGKAVTRWSDSDSSYGGKQILFNQQSNLVNGSNGNFYFFEFDFF